jgi:glycogen phosphorylase
VDVLHGPAFPSGELSEIRETALTYESSSEDGVSRFSGMLEPQAGGRVGYRVRILPNHPDLHDPFAAGLALWA